MSTPRIYLSGPMTGLPDYNYAAFNAEAARLRALGYTVENPAENVHPADQTYAGYMRAALAQMLTCDAIALLPGWPESRGAVIERQLAMDVDMLICVAASIDESFNEEEPVVYPPTPHVDARLLRGAIAQMQLAGERGGDANANWRSVASRYSPEFIKDNVNALQAAYCAGEALFCKRYQAK
jgi:Domain of unknown function (DUF4406)